MAVPVVVPKGEVVRLFRSMFSQLRSTPELYRQKSSALFEHVYGSYPERDADVYAQSV